MRGEFHRVYIEYVSKLNDIHAKRKFDFLEKVLADMYAHQTYFHHGFEYLKDLKPFMGDLTGTGGKREGPGAEVGAGAGAAVRAGVGAGRGRTHS